MFNEITMTDLIAIIALVMSAISVALEVCRWRKSGVRLTLSYIVHDDITPPYISVMVSNRGDTPTTLTKLTFVYHPTILDKWRYTLSRSFIRLVVPCSKIWKYLGSARSENYFFQDLNSKKPNFQFLDPGKTWIRSYPLDKHIDKINSEKLWLCVYANHTDKPANILLRRGKNCEVKS